jgi:hypothetical protein
MDPLRPTTISSTNIYSKEFAELVKRRLKPGGVLQAWVSSHEQLNTLTLVFPHVRLECGLDFVLASDEPIRHRRSVDAAMRSRLPERSWNAIENYLKVRCPANDTDAVYDKRVPILRDKSPVVEYHLGRYYHHRNARDAAAAP